MARRDVWVATNIYKTIDEDGALVKWRVYVYGPDPVRGISRLAAKRFLPADLPCVCPVPQLRCERCALAHLVHYRDTRRLEAKRLRRAGRRATAEAARPATDTFRAEAARYLALDVITAMPSFVTREYEINHWVTAFGDLPRSEITAPLIEAKLQAFKNQGYSGSTCNKLRTALMSLWTRLDGRSAANPVKDTGMFDEAELTARGQSYDLLTRILDAIPDNKTRGVKGKKGSSAGPSQARAILEVLAWTGMDPGQLKRMGRSHLNVKERWYITPHREKGSKRRRTPRPVIRKPMSEEAARAFQRFIAIGLLGHEFSTHNVRHTWERAIARVQKQLREERKDPNFSLPHIRLKDIRHSFGTRLFEETENLELVGRMLDHAPGSPMTLRYALGAVPSVLQRHVGQFPGRPVAGATSSAAVRSQKSLPANDTRRKTLRKRANG